jgi:hypothetical protein
MDKITQILEKVVRCKYFEAEGVHIKNPTKNSYQEGLGRTFDPNIRPCCCGPYINLRRESLKLTNIVMNNTLKDDQSA